MSRLFNVVLGLLIIIIMVWLMVAWPVFQWRNPKCNSMGYFRDFVSVVTFSKLDKYQ